MPQAVARISGRQKTTGADYYVITREVIKRSAAIVLAALIITMAYFIYVTEFRAPVYTVNATIAVSASGSFSTVFTNIQSANMFAEVFYELLNGRLISNRVAEIIGNGDFDISASQIAETNIVVMTVTASTPQEVFAAASAALDTYPEYTSKFIDNAITEVLLKPVVPSYPSNTLNLKRSCLVIFAASLIMAALTCGVIIYLTDNIKNESDADNKLDMHRLGTITHERTGDRLFTSVFMTGGSSRELLLTDPTTGFYFSESYKKLRSRIAVQLKKANASVLMVTSVLENEGKSTVSSNIALAFAQAGKRVLLIDGDLLKPSLWKQFGMSNSSGGAITNGILLNDLLNGKRQREDLPHHKKFPNLTVIFDYRAFRDRSERIISIFLKPYIRAERKYYDLIIIDTPPVTAAPDTQAFATYADAAVVVVKQGAAPVRRINDISDLLGECGTKVIGCICNDFCTSTLTDSYGYGHYGYGHYGHYGKYSADKYTAGKYGYGQRRSEKESGTSDTPDTSGK